MTRHHFRRLAGRGLRYRCTRCDLERSIAVGQRRQRAGAVAVAMIRTVFSVAGREVDEARARWCDGSAS